MTQLNRFGGNSVIPLTDHFGFGDPATPAGDGSSGPRVIASAGDPNGITAPIGSFALDYTTPGIWQNTTGAAVWVPLGGAAGGSGILPLRDGALVDPDMPTAIDNSDLNTPFVTIQAAIDALEAKALAESGGGPAYTSAAQMKVYTVYVAQGIYNESLTMPAGLSWALVARGTVVLGDGLGAGLSSTNGRNIRWFGDTALLPATSMSPTLTLATWTNGNPGAGTGDQNSGNWKISGSLTISDTGAGFAGGHLYLEGVSIADNLATGQSIGNGSAGATIRYFFERCNFEASVLLGGIPGNKLLIADQCRFASVSVHDFGTWTNCQFNGDVTVTAVAGDAVIPPGIIQCDWAVSGPPGLAWTGPIVADDYSLHQIAEKDVQVTGAITAVTGVGVSGAGPDGDPGNGNAIPVVTNIAVAFNIAAPGETNSMGAPSFPGQEAQLSVASWGGAGTRAVSVTGGVGSGGAVPSTLTFTAATNWILLRSIHINGNNLWRVVANPDGVAIT